MIIKVMEKNDYKTSLRLDMIIKVRKKIIKRNDYQASPRLDMIIKTMKKKVIKRNNYHVELKL